MRPDYSNPGSPSTPPDNASSPLSTPRKLVFGLQHMVAMFGATILVAIIVNSHFEQEINIGQITLLCAGLGTLLFHAVTGFKVPAFLGSSFAFLGGFAAIAHLESGQFANMSYAEKYPYALGGIVAAGVLYLALAGLIKAVGVQKVMRFFPPVVTGPIIICIGLSLMSSAIDNCSVNWPLAILAIGLVIFFNVWGKGMSKILAILLGVVISYVVAAIVSAFGVTNPDGSAIVAFQTIGASGWVGLPTFTFPKFDLSAILVMAPIALATMMEHIGDMSAISATVGENFIENPGLHRTLLGDGLATTMAGFLGGPANTTYGENTGVLALSKVYDPTVIRIAAVYAVFLGFVPKLASIFTAMPTAIIGGISLILYGMISAIGVRNMVENRVNLLNSRNLIVVALIMAAGLGTSTGLTFTLGSTSINLTSLALAAIIGVVANAILPGKDYEFGARPEGDIHRGISFNHHDRT